MDVRFPLGGLHRAAGFQSQPPYTMVDGNNVFARDPLDWRQRGGRRPGLICPDVAAAVDGEPVRLINSVDVVEADDQWAFWDDAFVGATSLAGVYSAISGQVLPTVVRDGVIEAAYDGGTVAASALVDVPADMDTSDDQIVLRLLCLDYLGNHWGKFRIFFHANESTADPLDTGYVAELDLTGSSGIYSFSHTHYSGGSPSGGDSGSGTFANGHQAGWLTLIITTAKTLLYFNGRQLSNINNYGPGLTGSSQQFGFQLVAEQSGGRVRAGGFRVAYRRSTESARVRTVMVAGIDKKLKYQAANGVFNDAVPESGTRKALSISEDVALESATLFQTIFVADVGPVIASGTAGSFPGSSKFDDTAYSDWTAVASLDEYDYGLRVDGIGDFAIDGVNTGDLDLVGNGIPSSGSGYTWRIFRCPKRMTPVAGTLGKWRATVGDGQIPLNCPLVARFFGECLALAGDPENPNILYLSRQGDAYDWAFAQDDLDPQAAWASTSSVGGSIGQPIRALIPGTVDWSYVGCTQSILLMQGHPMQGGTIDVVSETVGVVGPRAWCMVPEGPIVVLTQDGLYALSGLTAQPLSREVLPDELLDIDNTTFNVQLVYDRRHRGIWIFVTNRFDVAGRHFFFDWQGKTFWPVTLPSDMEPTSVYFNPSPDSLDQQLWLGGRDGYFRVPERRAPNDDGTAIAAHALIGPLSMGQDDRLGMIDVLRGELAAESGTVLWSLLVGDTPEAAKNATATASGVLAAGLSRHFRPRRTGKSCYVKIESENSQAWAFERIWLRRMTRGGLHRV